jgi:hypothetical protein
MLQSTNSNGKTSAVTTIPTPRVNKTNVIVDEASSNREGSEKTDTIA